MDYSLTAVFSKAEYEMLEFAAKDRGMTLDVWAYNTLRFAGLREMGWNDATRLVIPPQPGEKCKSQLREEASIAFWDEKGQKKPAGEYVFWPPKAIRDKNAQKQAALSGLLNWFQASGLATRDDILSALPGDIVK